MNRNRFWSMWDVIIMLAAFFILLIYELFYNIGSPLDEDKRGPWLD